MKNNGNVVFLVLLFSFTMIFRLDSFQVSASGINQSEAPILEPTQINEQSMIEELETGCEDPACANPGDTGSTGCDSQDPACANPGDTGSTGCDSQDPACANPGDTALPACEPQDLACRGGVIGDTSEVCESSDPSCESQGGPLLFLPEVDCGDGVDDNGDDQIDGEHPSCGDAGGPFPGIVEDNCSDDVENNGDGAIDGEDPTCEVTGGEPSPELDCGDGVDNNGDGAIDGEDPTCEVTGGEPSPELDCGDGVDNNGDGAIDGEDPTCGSTPPPPSGELDCGDGIDNDGDDAIDGEDPDCGGQPPNPRERYCSDGIDNDGNGKVDDLNECESLCFDGVDNDGDGKVDTSDNDCQPGGPPPFSVPGQPATTPVIDSSLSKSSQPTTTDSSTARDKKPVLDVLIGAEAALPREDNCIDGIDNNHNGLKDSEDPACVAPEISYAVLNSSLGRIDLKSPGNVTSSQINVGRNNGSISTNGSNISVISILGEDKQHDIGTINSIPNKK